MSIKVGINGFGRIGRVVFRILCERSDEFELCGINLRNADLEYMVYLIKYDSIFGNFPGEIKAVENGLLVNGKLVTVFSYSNLEEIPWRDCGAEYIIESTGAFLTKDTAGKHLVGGAKKVIVTAPAKDDMPTFVIGVNQNTFTPDMDVVSNASCTTNCLAPMAKVLNDTFGIEEGLVSTIHSATSKQKPVDARAGRDWRTGRSVFNNIIPSTTGAAKACGLVIPDLKGKLTGMSFRVPVNDVSIVDMTVSLKTPTTYEAICKAMKDASENEYKGIIDYLEDEVVSSDLRGHKETCIFDAKEGIMLNDHFVKLLAWYDNEWGYSSKVVDLVKYVHDESAE
ncbi:MAG: type I glyceraldehyde-3-phosphate dehydrogenase [Oscillospiraceae bacterium]|nr:type I glyceraldehyde-3-phosphate dehydrogenase [Candidatus Limimonas coprohippi]